jgi:hypothetical protein
MSGVWVLEIVPISCVLLVVKMALQSVGIARGQHDVIPLRFVKYRIDPFSNNHRIWSGFYPIFSREWRMPPP